MNRMNRRILCAFLSLLLLLPLWPAGSEEEGQAYAFNRYELDPEAMKALEQQDEFPVRVTKKVVTDGVKKMTDNPDMLTLTVENRSGDTVAALVLLVVAYDEDNRATPIQWTNTVALTGTAKRQISVWPYDSLDLKPDGTWILNVSCEHRLFKGVRVLVAEYTDAEGETHVNELNGEWQELALGSPTIVLD